jgi:pimeloyl-ACP methyl ester carboxylesterase
MGTTKPKLSSHERSSDAPTLIIHGTDDKTVPIDAAGGAAAKGIAQAELIENDGARTACSQPIRNA